MRRYWDGVDVRIQKIMQVVVSERVDTMQVLASIGMMGQIHQLCEGTTNLAWAAARVADYESMSVGEDTKATGDDTDLFDTPMVT